MLLRALFLSFVDAVNTGWGVYRDSELDRPHLIIFDTSLIRFISRRMCKKGALLSVL